MDKLTLIEAQFEFKNALKSFKLMGNTHARAILLHFENKPFDVYFNPVDYEYTKEEIYGRVALVIKETMQMEGVKQAIKHNNDTDPRAVKQALAIWQDWIKTGGDCGGKRLMAKDTRAAYELLKKENVL